MTNNIVPYLQQEYEHQKTLFESQPPIVQRFLESQAQEIAEVLITKAAGVQFVLPDRVVVSPNGKDASVAIPEATRHIRIRNLLGRDVQEALMHRLNELEGSTVPAMSTGAGLLRYAAAMHMVQDLLPDGRSIRYRSCEGEEIPSIPVDDEFPESAITQASDAIVEEGDRGKRGEVQTPFVPAARKFFLPQWVAFDDLERLLVGSVEEAEGHVRSMQRYVTILHRSLALAPYISVNEEYRRKRYGILGQLVNQGRALANYKTREIISEIRERVAKQSLNRGLSVSLPFFDDQTLQVETSNLEIIPAGRILFFPAFVVRAARGEQVRVAQDTRLNASTRRHLLAQLRTLEAAFES